MITSDLFFAVAGHGYARLLSSSIPFHLEAWAKERNGPSSVSQLLLVKYSHNYVIKRNTHRHTHGGISLQMLKLDVGRLY